MVCGVVWYHGAIDSIMIPWLVDELFFRTSLSPSLDFSLIFSSLGIASCLMVLVPRSHGHWLEISSTIGTMLEPRIAWHIVGLELAI